MQQVRNNRGEVIGYITTIHDGVQQIRNKTGRLLGWYDPQADRTTDAKTGNWMGVGNQIMMLLGNDLNGW